MIALLHILCCLQPLKTLSWLHLGDPPSDHQAARHLATHAAVQLTMSIYNYPQSCQPPIISQRIPGGFRDELACLRQKHARLSVSYLMPLYEQLLVLPSCPVGAPHLVLLDARYDLDPNLVL